MQLMSHIIFFFATWIIFIRIGNTIDTYTYVVQKKYINTEVI